MTWSIFLKGTLSIATATKKCETKNDKKWCFTIFHLWQFLLKVRSGKKLSTLGDCFFRKKTLNCFFLVLFRFFVSSRWALWRSRYSKIYFFAIGKLSYHIIKFQTSISNNQQLIITRFSQNFQNLRLSCPDFEEMWQKPP